MTFINLWIKSNVQRFYEAHIKHNIVERIRMWFVTKLEIIFYNIELHGILLRLHPLATNYYWRISELMADTQT